MPFTPHPLTSRAACLLALGLSSWIGAAHARAQPSHAAARLDYVATPTDCPTEAAFTEWVESRLGRPPFDDHASAVVVVSLHGESPTLGTVRWRDPEAGILGERALEANGCADLAESLAVAVAILLEDPPVGPEDVPPLLASPAPEVLAPAPPTPVAEAPSEPDPIPWVIELGGSVDAGLGWTPGVSLGAELRGGLSWGLISFHLAAAFEIQPETAVLPSGDGVDAFHGLFGLGFCLRPAFLSICVEGGGGVFQSTVRSVLQPTARTSASAYVSVRAAAHLRIVDGLAIEPWISASVLPLRPALMVDGDRVWEAPIVAGRLGVSVIARVQ